MREEDGNGPLVGVTLRLGEAERRAFKSWCALEGLTQAEAFREGLALLRAARAAGLATEDAAAVVAGLRAFEVDAELEITVERRGPGRWAVRRGAGVIDRDLQRVPEPMPSSRDEAFLERTRFGLGEAIAVARAHAARVRG